MKKLPLLASTLLAATALATPAFAGDLTWNGEAGDNTWNTSSENWTGDSTTFTEGDNVTFGSTGAGDITLGEAITAGNITFTEGGYTISGSSLTGERIRFDGTDGTTVTIAVTEATFTLIDTQNHSQTGGSGDNQSDNYKNLIFGDGTNTTTVTATSLNLQGQSEISVAANATVTITGDATAQGGYLTALGGAGTMIIEGTFNHSSSFALEISIANLQVDTFAGAAGSNTFSGASVTIGTMTTGSGATTFSGTSSAVESLTLSSSNVSLTYTGSGTHTIGELQAHVSGAATLDYSELTGSLIITKLDFGDSSTLTINGNDKGTITEVSFTNTGVTLAVNGTVNVGTMNITTNNDTPTINIGDGATLNVTTMNVYPGGFGSGYYTKVNGVSADTSTFITGKLTIGSGTTGAGLEVKNTTFITGGITFSHETTSNGYFYLYLDDVTLGFTQSTTIEAGGGISSYIELGDKDGSSMGTTTTASTTVINTNQYSTTDGAFTSTGLSIEIQEAIAGTGTLEVTGNGKLTLSGENTYSGGTKVTSGTVVANNASALGSGDVSIKGGATLQLETATTVEGTVSFSENATLVLTDAFLASAAEQGDMVAIITASAITYNDSELTYSLETFLDDCIDFDDDKFDVTFSYSGGVLSAEVTYLPEPSMFGLMFGLGAIGLVATRRRRRA